MRMRGPVAGVVVLVVALASAIAAGAGEPQRGGTLNWGIVAEPPTYDCHAATTFAVMQRVAPHYSTLLKYEQNNFPKIVGDVAKSWTVSPDHLVYTFKLHPNIKFHDGSVLTSADVKASYERMMAPPPGIISARFTLFKKIASIETPDPLTVVFRMKEVDASMMDNFASPWNCLYSAAKLKADPNFPARNILGTGPFKFVEHVAGSHWVGKRFEDYFRTGRPYLDGFRAITMTASAMLSAMESEHIFAEFRGFSPPERDRLVRGMGDKAKVYQSPWVTYNNLSFNVKKKPFDDERVRRALSLAIDRWGGAASLGKISLMGAVGGVLVPGGDWSATDEEIVKLPGFGKDMEANRAKARSLLKEAGVEKLTFTLTNRNIKPFVEGGIYVIDQWRQIGVTVNHRQLELAGWTAAFGNGDFEVLMDSFTDISANPTTGLLKYASADRAPENRTFSIDRKLDQLYDEQARTMDPAKRRRIVREIEEYALEKAYAVPLLHWTRIVVHNSRVQGWTMSPLHMIYQDLADVWLKN